MTEYTGDWVGHVVFTASGTVDMETRQADATAEQWFYGIYAKDGSSGSIHFRSVVHIDLSTGAFHDTSWILDGTCGFAGSSGRIEFEGAQPAGLVGSGGYVGSWSSTTPRTQSIPCDPGIPAIELPS